MELQIWKKLDKNKVLINVLQTSAVKSLFLHQLSAFGVWAASDFGPYEYEFLREHCTLQTLLRIMCPPFQLHSYFEQK